ncbi:Fe(3+) ABC transporter substrate-binding protein [Hahella sp. SMD15-11]|uniref:Fe(3+) ABC transporter substrate-binding protein n=1 Tax=Thermohahella caldifontis TaxID=3142973 RepID=A0AB39UYH9_9GAMM
MKRSLKRLLTLSVAALSLQGLNVQAAETVNIYSNRQPYLIQPILSAFTRETGIETQVVYAKKGIAERLKREGRNSPADVVLTVDIGRLQELVDSDVVQPVKSATLEKNIPAQYRDPEGRWFGLTVRARAIYASKERVKTTQLDYEDLAKPEFKGKVCTRSGKHPYNLALIASFIAHKGEAATEEWLKGVKANLARKPQGNDRAQVKAIYEGICDVSLGNSYYLGKMLTDEKQSKWANAVNIIFPNQDDRGAHVNISGAALTKAAPHKEAAIRLIEFLSDRLAQKMYAEQNFEYPVNPAVEPSGLVESWGKFKADTLPLSEVAKHRKAAAMLVDKINFDG